MIEPSRLLAVVFSVHTAWPAARSAFTIGQLGMCPFYATCPGLNELCAFYPANPFVTS